jgi:hypothetical protein
MRSWVQIWKFLSMDQDTATKNRCPRPMHKQRLILVAVASAAIAGSFLPIGNPNLLPSIYAVHFIRKIAVGLFVLVVLASFLYGGHRRELPIAPQLGSWGMTGLIVIFCIYRMVALGSRKMPTFDDDDPRASAFYQRACDSGEMNACALLGACYWTGTCGLTKDGSHGVDLYQKACDGGDMEACGVLGTCYEQGGCGLTKNSGRAVSLYEKACAGGDMGMCNNLGVCYQQGQCGLVKDDARAIGLYRKACKGGDPGACHNVEVAAH